MSQARSVTPIGVQVAIRNAFSAFKGISDPVLGISIRMWLGAFLAVVFAAPVVSAIASGPTFFDDAYMFHRYAMNVRDGLGIAWNPDGVQTYGLTSHLWLLVVLAFSFLPVPAGTMLQMASAAASVAALAVMGLAVARNARTRWLADPIVATVAAGLPLLASSAFTYHLTSGMDTMLSMAMHGLVVLTVLRYMAEPSLRRATVVGVVAFAAVLTRPENGLCALGVPALAFLAMWRLERWRDLAGLVVLPVLLIGAALAVFGQVYGTPLPLSFYAKSLHAYAGFQNPENAVAYLVLALSLVLVYVPLLIASVRRRDAGLVIALLVPVLATFAYLTTLRQVMGWLGRYYIPFLPYLIVPALLLLDRALADADLRRALPRRLAWAAGAVVAVVCAWLPLQEPVYAAYARRVIPAPVAMPALPIAAAAPLPRIEWDAAITTIASHIAARLPKGASMAASEVGILGSIGRHATLIDLVGLNDTTIGRRGFSMDYLLSRAPDFIWLPHTDYTGLRAQILSDQRLYEQYDVYAGAFTYGIAVRREGQAPRGGRSRRAQRLGRGLSGARDGRLSRAAAGWAVARRGEVSDKRMGSPQLRSRVLTARTAADAAGTGLIRGVHGRP